MSFESDLQQKLNFNDINTGTPDSVINKMGKLVEEATKGIVKGEVKTYSGEIESYSKMYSLAALAASLNGITHDIQDDLGEIGFESFKYEFCLIAPALPNYKFRVLFFEYGIGGYPVKLVLEQGVADDIFNQEDAEYILQVYNQNELEKTTNCIIQSNRVIGILQELINATKRSLQTPVEQALLPIGEDKSNESNK